jgi:predicted secreted hydrolase
LPAAWAEPYPEVRSGVVLHWPQDHAAHPAFRTEWWYLTGWLDEGDGASYGFQVTFFRIRRAAADANPSAFAPRQLLFAHAALADPRRGRLVVAQRAGRVGFGLAHAEDKRLAVRLDHWWLEQRGTKFFAEVRDPNFTLNLEFDLVTPMVHGDAGLSRKGRAPPHASFYYSLPQLVVRGQVRRGDAEPRAVTGRAWFDHEWASQYLEEAAVGWDWVGINGDDGSALMLFRTRSADGSQRWAGGTWRSAGGEVVRYAPEQIEFAPRRWWRSPRSGVSYPVEMQLRVGDQHIRCRPLFDDQELDSAVSTGVLYWEGATRCDGSFIGRGYLELTGYAGKLRF